MYQDNSPQNERGDLTSPHLNSLGHCEQSASRSLTGKELVNDSHIRALLDEEVLKVLAKLHPDEEFSTDRDAATKDSYLVEVHAALEEWSLEESNGKKNLFDTGRWNHFIDVTPVARDAEQEPLYCYLSTQISKESEAGVHVLSIDEESQVRAMVRRCISALVKNSSFRKDDAGESSVRVIQSDELLAVWSHYPENPEADDVAYLIRQGDGAALEPALIPFKEFMKRS